MCPIERFQRRVVELVKNVYTNGLSRGNKTFVLRVVK